MDFVVEIFDITIVNSLNEGNILLINSEGCETGIDTVNIISKTDLSNKFHKLVVWR